MITKKKIDLKQFAILYATNPLHEITTFAWTMDMKAVFPVPPFMRKFLQWMKQISYATYIYKQLYPT